MKLRISEIFYSIQGEGPTLGMPALFIRLGGCPLGCCWCDTTEVWEVWDDIAEGEQEPYLKRRLLKVIGDAKLPTLVVITGGEPLSPDNRRASRWLVESFLPKFYAEHGTVPYRVEIETSGVFGPLVEVTDPLTYIVSPKLSDSGLVVEDRLPAVLGSFLQPPLYQVVVIAGQEVWWKFVVARVEDVAEVNKIVEDFSIPRSRVMLMPMVTKAQNYATVGRKVALWAMEYGYRFSPREHIALWDQTTGV